MLSDLTVSRQALLRYSNCVSYFLNGVSLGTVSVRNLLRKKAKKCVIIKCVGRCGVFGAVKTVHTLCIVVLSSVSQGTVSLYSWVCSDRCGGVYAGRACMQELCVFFSCVVGRVTVERG